MTAAAPWDLWPLLAFALTVGWLWRWGRRNDAAVGAVNERRRVMRRLTRARNHDHGGGTVHIAFTLDRPHREGGTVTARHSGVAYRISDEKARLRDTFLAAGRLKQPGFRGGEL